MEERSHPFIISLIFCGAFLAFLLLSDVRESFSHQGRLWLYTPFLSLLTAYIVTPLAITIARWSNIIDVPGGRSIHLVPTPLLGGVAVYVSFASALVYTFNFSWEMKGVALSATIIFLLGLLDDVFNLKPQPKLLVQIVAVLILVFHDVTITLAPDGWGFWGDALNLTLTFLWVIGITNAVNFLDGLDGLATGLGVISSFFIGVIGVFTGQVYLTYLGFGLMGACIGFLPYNFRRKRNAMIYLGDAGSTFIGYTLASMTVMGGWGAEYPIKAYAIPMLILGVPIFDMIYITGSRFLTNKVTGFKEWIGYEGGKDHLHHRLLNLGFSQKKAVLFIYFLSASLGMGALVVRDGGTLEGVLVLLQGLLIFVLLSILMIVGERNVGERSNHEPSGEKDPLAPAAAERGGSSASAS